MEVILLDNIDGIGRKGEQVNISTGYGRNFLLPTGRAMRVTKDNLFRLQTLRKKFVEEERQLLVEVKAVAKSLGGFTIQLVEKATEEGHLFGSVNHAVLARALVKAGFKVTDKMVHLAEPIKSVGTYPVPVALHHEVTVEISVVVDREGGMPKTEPTEKPAGGDEKSGEGAEGKAEKPVEGSAEPAS